MIKVTRLNGTSFIVSVHQVELVEQTPDTVVSLVSGRKILVKESAEELVEKAISYWQKIGKMPIKKEN